MTGTYRENYDELQNVLKTEIADKWDLEIINMWDDNEVNAILQQNANRYLLADGVHITTAGYESVLLQVFRRYFDRTEGVN